MPKKSGHVVARISNERGIPVLFVLEPWGEVYEMPPNATFEIVSQGPPDGAAEVSVGDDRFTVHGWPGSALQVVPEKGRLRTVPDEAAAARFLKGRPARRTVTRRAQARA